jgi:PilZ domain.
MVDDVITLDEIIVTEDRQQRRFNAARSIPGYFGTLPVDVVNLSGGGMQIEHEGPLRIGTVGQLRVEIVGEETAEFSVRVAWGRLSKHVDGEGRFCYRSGVTLTDDAHGTIGAMGRLIRASARPDSGSLERKRMTVEQKRQSRLRPVASRIQEEARARAERNLPVTEQQLSLVRDAGVFFTTHPDDAQKWYARARYSLATVQGDRKLHYSQDVLAIWEYLGGTVEVGLIPLAIRILNDEARKH